MATSSRKRLFHELDSLENADKPLPNASLHAAIKSISPVKKGRNSIFFDGVIADANAKMRLVGFNSDQQKKMSYFFREKIPVNIENCEIKQSRQGFQTEVMLKSTSRISESPKKIDISTITRDDDEPEASPTVTLDTLYKIQNFQRVTLNIKVITNNEPTYVTGGKRKQDVIVADHYGTAKLVLWEDKVDSLEENESYTLKNFVVREYKAKKYLSMPKEGWSVVKINDIGEVEDPESDSETTTNKAEVNNAQIIAVPQLDRYKACLRCKARVEPVSPPLGICSKSECGLMQRYDLCTEQLSAKLLVMATTSPNKYTYTLNAFGKVIQQLAGVPPDGEVTAENLLNTPLIPSLSYNENNVITGFHKE